MDLLHDLFDHEKPPTTLPPNPQTKTDPRCSVCHRNSFALMAEFYRRQPGALVRGRNWVGTCPVCEKRFCPTHAGRVRDPSFGDLAPGCPTHLVLLKFG